VSTIHLIPFQFLWVHLQTLPYLLENTEAGQDNTEIEIGIGIEFEFEVAIDLNIGARSGFLRRRKAQKWAEIDFGFEFEVAIENKQDFEVRVAVVMKHIMSLN